MMWLLCLILVGLMVWQRERCISWSMLAVLRWYRCMIVASLKVPDVPRSKGVWIQAQQGSVLVVWLCRIALGRPIYWHSQNTVPWYWSWIGVRAVQDVTVLPSKTVVISSQPVMGERLSLFAYAGGVVDAHVPGAACRRWLTLYMEPARADWQNFELQAWKYHIQCIPSIVSMWLHQRGLLRWRWALADATGRRVSRVQAIAGVIMLRAMLAEKLQDQRHVGVCMPPSVAGNLLIMALLSLGKVVVPVNYTLSANTVGECLRMAGVEMVISAERFMQRLAKKGFEVAALQSAFHWVDLESLKGDVSKRSMIKAWLQSCFAPINWLEKRLVASTQPQEVATILFSSGSESAPKGIVLTHQNVLANALQAEQAIVSHRHDVVLGSLPLFHAFGLTVTAILPMLFGLPLVSMPDPREAKQVGNLVARYHVTFMCATSSLLRLYAKSSAITPEQLRSLRLVIAGGEKLQPAVKALFERNFDRPIYEGYGATELSPVVSLNRPNGQYRDGAVGQPVAGCFVKVVDPETLAPLAVGEPGLLLVAGINVMRGYCQQPQETRTALIEQDGMQWYRTGDQASIDADGFIHLHDRYARFAKVGAEMVSLSQVELRIAEHLSEDAEILAISVEDAQKGEVVVLMYAAGVNEAEIKYAVAQANLPNLAKPKRFIPVEALPKLGSGKADFVTAKQWVRNGIPTSLE